ncbi:hypothetical protein ABKN59_006445 [Abortiporus biennis]
MLNIQKQRVFANLVCDGVGSIVKMILHDSCNAVEAGIVPPYPLWTPSGWWSSLIRMSFLSKLLFHSFNLCQEPQEPLRVKEGLNNGISNI